ncbi:hypothetical protein [Jiangella asiatica]|uniref:Uncharacterized protein n=1 Tax=Jiangella asiatica TaxID=2530372 RepID=A0A4R5DJD6_9ACTN|nr:hypothetical protein [Jiangella asiatica]TDE13447.1 hypothetical protein E1269_05270 [Jiangella asiatica]
MTQSLKAPVKARIRRVDDTLRRLVERRGRCEDPTEILRATESIDRWLDERLVLMRNRDDRQLATSGRASG